MKKFVLKKLTLRNFKGVRFFELFPNEKETVIMGENEAGKTTLATAPVWTKYGKDLEDRADYEIQTYDENNNLILDLEHSVEEVYDVDGDEISLTRIYVPEYTEKDDIRVLTGHHTEYKWCDVPLKRAKDFSEKVSSFFGNEIVYKILTNPLFFNSDKFGWANRRKIFIDMVGEVTDEDVASIKPSFRELMAELTNKTMEEYKIQLKTRIAKIDERVSLIPDLIKENKRNIPEEPDYTELQSRLSEVRVNLETIDAQLRDRSELMRGFILKKEAYFKNLNSLNDLLRKTEESAREESQKAENEKSLKVYDLRLKINNLENDIRLAEKSIETAKADIARKTEEQAKLRTRFSETAASELIFDPDAFSCPACNTPYNPKKAGSIRDAMLANFNRNKSAQLDSINREGGKLKSEIEELQVKAVNLEKEKTASMESLITVQSELKVLSETPVASRSYEAILAGNTEYQKIKEQRDFLQANPIKEEHQDNSSVETEKKQLETMRDTIKKQLDIKDQVERINTRNRELEAEHKKLAQEKVSLKKDLDTIEDFEDTRISTVEERVNHLFRNIKIKMFEKRLNGETKNICDTIIKGVPFSSANDAAKIQAGIEIINVLHDHYEIILPIFCDNRESVTMIPETKAQVINLYVNPDYKTLTVK